LILLEACYVQNPDLGVVIPLRLGNLRVSQKALLPVGKEQISLQA
jgi:hypothetical protein